MRKKLLFLFRRGPYGSVSGREGLDAVLVAAAFDQAVSLLFLDDGVYQLVAGQSELSVAVKNHSPAFRSLPLYDVEHLYVDAQSLEQRGLTDADLLMPVTLLEQDAVSALIEAQDSVLSF